MFTCVDKKQPCVAYSYVREGGQSPFAALDFNPGETTAMPLDDLIPALCRRPRMFVTLGSFQEVITLLKGYDTALFEFAPPEVKATSLTEFGLWLTRTHETADGVWQIDGEEVAANLFWSAKFRRLYPADEEAFEALPRLYQQFLDEMQCRIQENT